MTKPERQLAEALDRIKRLERQCLELQHVNSELRHAHRQAFAILRDSH